jgi:hypothetical protein
MRIKDGLPELDSDDSLKDASATDKLQDVRKKEIYLEDALKIVRDLVFEIQNMAVVLKNETCRKARWDTEKKKNREELQKILQNLWDGDFNPAKVHLRTLSLKRRIHEDGFEVTLTETARCSPTDGSVKLKR